MPCIFFVSVLCCVLHLHVITHRLLVASSRALRALPYVLLRCWLFPPRSWISVSDFHMLHIYVALLLFPLDALLMSIYRVVLNFPPIFFFFFYFLKYLEQTVVLVFLLVLPSKIASVLPNIFPFQSMRNSVCIQPPSFTSLRQELSYSAYTSLNVILKWRSW